VECGGDGREVVVVEIEGSTTPSHSGPAAIAAPIETLLRLRNTAQPLSPHIASSEHRGVLALNSYSLPRHLTCTSSTWLAAS
jgi:hypothetical protein